ncbi:hypothetical protein [Streptomyces sp. NPDC001502]|uniref:hypothetical protein n=1 Tax=Streptomyces sp. NPDC001502 TaxID=3364578 RepID=UPI0036B7C256
MSDVASGGTYVAGAEPHPQFDRRAWLLAHDKIGIPTALPAVTPPVAGPRGRTRTVRLDDPVLVLADDVEREDRLSGCSTVEDAEALVELAAG